MNKPVLNILAIDDDFSCLLAYARFITLVGGHKVETAKNGETGVRKAAELRPDIILLDMCMPGMNGLEVMDALCAAPATREIPVILITGGELTEGELARLKSRRNFMLVEYKPASMGKLLATIEAALRPPPQYAQRESGDAGADLAQEG